MREIAILDRNFNDKIYCGREDDIYEETADQIIGWTIFGGRTMSAARRTFLWIIFRRQKIFQKFGDEHLALFYANFIMLFFTDP